MKFGQTVIYYCFEKDHDRNKTNKQITLLNTDIWSVSYHLLHISLNQGDRYACLLRLKYSLLTESFLN